MQPESTSQMLVEENDIVTLIFSDNDNKSYSVSNSVEPTPKSGGFNTINSGSKYPKHPSNFNFKKKEICISPYFVRDLKDL